MKRTLGEINRLCTSCRRKCKQQAIALIASCPQYQPLPPDLRSPWRQLDLPLWGKT